MRFLPHSMLALAIWSAVVCIAGASPLLTKAAPNASLVPDYSLFELTLNLSSQYRNPFDPAQIDIGADFISPSGQKRHIVGFLYQDYLRSLSASGDQVLTPSGNPVWEIRFCPDEAGVWRYTVSARDSTGLVQLPEARFTAARSSNPGFVRVSALNPRAFAFDDGKPFFAIGEDMCWGGRRETYDYDDWLPKLQAADGNWIRIWSWAFHYGLEWSDTGSMKGSGYGGVGRYNMANAWQLDKILDTAADHGVYCMLTLGAAAEIDDKGGYFGGPSWPNNPYNVVNGGPCATPDDLWTDPTAQRLYRQRLRYIMARYGWRTNIQAWEFWNEVNAPPSWVQMMAQYLKGTGPYSGKPADPYHHLITQTYGDDATWRIPEVDWTQTHYYGQGNQPDLTPSVISDAIAMQAYDKPHLMSEFGIDWRKPDTSYDPEGKAVDMHNGIWSAAVSGNAGSAMIWWWDSYVDPLNLYHELTPLARFTADVPWTSPMWITAKAASKCADPATIADAHEQFRDMTLQANGAWGKGTTTDFVVDPSQADSTQRYPGFLYSPAKPDLRSPLRFLVDYVQPGRFVVRVHQVSNKANLRILVDGVVVKEFPFDASPPADPAVKPAYISTEYEPTYNIYLATFDTDCGVDIPAGKHVIELDVSSGDWLNASSYTFGRYRSSRYADLRITGTVCCNYALLWVENVNHDWMNVYQSAPIPVVRGASAILHGLNPGRYDVEFTDTDSGDVIQRYPNEICGANGLLLRLPDISTDIAVKIK